MITNQKNFCRTGAMILGAIVFTLFAGQAKAQQLGDSTLVAWFEANAGVTTSGGLVTNWASQAGSSYAIPTAASGNSAPTLVNNVLGGKPAIHFNGSTGLQLQSLSDVNPSYTMFIVLANYTNASEAVGADSINLRFGNSGSAGNLNIWPGSVGASLAASSTGGSIITAVVGAGSGGVNTLQVFQQGTQILATTPNTGYAYSIAFEGNSTFGFNAVLNANGYAPYTGDIAEVLVYNTALSSADIQSVDNYLSAKYAITTASGDYATAFGYGTTASSYASLVAGVYNIGGGNPTSWVATDPLFEIGDGGNGSEGGNPEATGPSDAFIIYKNGNAILQGTLEITPGGDIPMYTGN